MSSSDEDPVRIPSLRSSIRRRNLKGKTKLCPRCLGELSLMGELSGWLVPEEYICESCGYHGHVSLEPLPKDSSNGK